MLKILFKIIIGGIILLLLTPTNVGAVSSSDSTGVEPDDDTSLIHSTPRTPAWPAPKLDQTSGDNFNHRAIFVHQDDSTYLDDLLFCSAIPAAVHWEGGTKFESMMISDAAIRENGNLIGDYSEYLRKISSEIDIDFIGIVDTARKAQLVSYFDDVNEVNDVTYEDNVYEGSADIARYYWSNQRQLGIDTAVLAYVPNANGGTEIRRDTSGSRTGQFSVGVDLTADELAWLKFEIEWNDPQANTDYRIGIRDPYALHPLEHNNLGQVGHTNPTNNKLYSNSGYGDIGLSPYYSYLPFKEYSYPPGYDQLSFNGTLPVGDKSAYPLPAALDHKTFQFGPVKKGQWIAVVTDWIYHVNATNASDYRDFDSFIYEPGKGPGDDFLLEASFEPLFFKGQRPEYGYCMATEDGDYSVTIHTRPFSINGSFGTTVYWGFTEPEKTWNAQQLNPGSDSLEFHYKEYPRTSDAMTESVTNGAVVAALKNVPMLYTAGDTPEYAVVQALEELNIENLVIIDPADMIEISHWQDLGLEVVAKKSDVDVFDYIYEISKSKGLDKSLVLNAQGGPWFSGAAFSAAYHGAPVPALDDPEIVEVLNQATVTWWQTTQSDVVYMRPVFTENNTPKQRIMEEISVNFFNWLEGFNIDFNPDCNDANGDGVPDTGSSWDYSEDVDIIVVSPLNTIKPTLDRAINGKASIGRIPIADPSALWAVLNREMLYWKVGFSQADNPENPNDMPPTADHWNKAGWSFVSYTHDDSNPNDNDNGDSDDDDYCGFDDGGQVHKSYRPREELPLIAESYGKTNDFHTYYTNVRTMLENGVSFWSQNGHGSHNYMMETGIGITSLGADPSDPKWTGPNPPDDGFIDPPVDPVSGWDLYYEIDNLHSPFIVMMACQVGGSRHPENLLRTGAVAALGSTVITAKKSTSMFLDRTSRGLFSGLSFGESHRWAVDECSNVYSMHDPTTNDYLYSDLGYSDTLWRRAGDTVQTVLYGDPDLVMIAPTLWVDVQWSYPKSGENLVINISIRDQDGVWVTPDSMAVQIDSVPLTAIEQYKGFYQVDWQPSLFDTHYELQVAVSADGYVSPKGEPTIVRDYGLYVPKLIVQPGYVNYTGGFVQAIDVEARACHPSPLNSDLTDTNTNYIRARVYNENDEYTGVSGDLSYLTADLWEIVALNVSSLPVGNYYVVLGVSACYRPYFEVRTGNFSVDHRLFFKVGEVVINEAYKSIGVGNISVFSTYSVDGRLTPTTLSTISYEIFEFKFGPGDDHTGISGELSYNELSQEFYIDNLNLASLPLGQYYVQLTAATSYSETYSYNTAPFVLDEPISIFGVELEYKGEMTQILDIYDIAISSSQNPDDIVASEIVTEAKYSIYDNDNTLTDLSGDLINDDNGWGMKVNVSSLDEGSYYVKLYFNTVDYGSNYGISPTFNITHILTGNIPTIEYIRSDQTLKITNLKVRSSFEEAPVLNTKHSSEHTYSIFSERDDSFVDVSGELQFEGDEWVGTCSVAELAAGDYYVVCKIGYKGITFESRTDTFRVLHDLHVSQPKIEYSADNDTIHVYEIDPYFAMPELSYLTNQTATKMWVSVYNESGSLVLNATLDFDGIYFYKIFYNISEDLEDGQYYAVVIFATEFIDDVAINSDRFNVTAKPDAQEDQDSGEVAEDDSGWILWAAALIAVVIVVVFMLLFLFLKYNLLAKITNKWKGDKSKDSPQERSGYEIKWKDDDDEISY